MSNFSIKEPKEIDFLSNSSSTYPYQNPNNIDISGYYEVNGDPINDLFYPALTYNNADKDVSNIIFTNRTNNALTSGTSNLNLNQVTWSPDLGLFALVAQAAYNGRIATSPDGINWTLRNSGVTLSNVTQISLLNCTNVTGNIISCTSTANLEIGMNIDTTSTGVTTTDPTIISIDNSNNRFETSSFISASSITLFTNAFTCTDTSGLLPGFFVSSASTSGQQCLNVYSLTKFRLTNGQNFSGTTCFADRQWRDIIWCKDLSGTGMFVACAISSTGQQIITSNDGITWINRNTPVDYNNIFQIAYSPTLKRVVCTADTSGFIYSNDGINWTAVNPFSGNVYSSIAWSPELGVFVALGFDSSSVNNVILTSSDGINWIKRPGPISSWGALAWSSELGIFCALARNTTLNIRNVMISKDGINWDNNYSTPEANEWRTCVWSPQLRIFFAVAGTGTNRFAYSYDGKQWTMVTAPTASVGYRGVTWSPELGIFVTVGVLGNNTNTVATSTLRARPPTSYNVFDSSFNNINERGMWTFSPFGRGIPVTKTTSFTVAPSENWIICNGAITATLPDAAKNTGEELTFKTISASAVTCSPAIIQLDGTESTSLLDALAGKWKTIVSNGSKWVTQQAN